jgi:hypothetical protein
MGLAIKTLWDEFEGGVVPLSPKNKLVAAGPLTGLPGPNLANLGVAAKSPHCRWDSHPILRVQSSRWCQSGVTCPTEIAPTTPTPNVAVFIAAMVVTTIFLVRRKGPRIEHSYLSRGFNSYLASPTSHAELLFGFDGHSAEQAVPSRSRRRCSRLQPRRRPPGSSPPEQHERHNHHSGNRCRENGVASEGCHPLRQGRHREASPR